MREVVVSATARSELRNIASYLASFGSGTARYRVALVKSYLLLYKVGPDGSVSVAHVFHQSQDYARLVAEIH